MKTVSFAAIVLMSSVVSAAAPPATVPASQPARQAAKAGTPESTWHRVVAAMQAGDKQALARVTTDKGFKALLGGKPDAYTPEKMKVRSKDWHLREFHLTQPDAKNATASINKPQVEGGFGLRFVHTAEGWKVHDLLIGE